VTARDAAGNTATDTLTVTYTPPDTTAPVITITSPTSNDTYAASSTPLTLAGTATDNVAVTQVSWANDRGGSGTASGTSSWIVSGIVLQSGSNVLTVTARDAAGNTASDTLTVTYNAPDTVKPTAAITWPTRNASYVTSSSPIDIQGTATDNVAVTQVRWANNKGGNGVASGTTSWDAPGIPLQNGDNVITVTASDAAGNAGTAALTVTYSPSDTTPPIISAVTARVSATGAIISWTTNEPADSQVDYGRYSAYGESTAPDANLVTEHSQTLSGLTARTGYHFRIRSRDASGNLAASQDYTFRTGSSDTTSRLILYYPRVSRGHKKHAAEDAEDQYTAIALTNLDTTDATLVFVAYDQAGALLSGANVTNPVTRSLKPGQQMPVIDVQLFGAGIAAGGPVGWIEVDSSTSKLTGFFMSFDSRLTLLDGAEISSTLLRSSVLPVIADSDYTRVQLANPGADPAEVRLDLMKVDGSIRGSAQQTIQPLGTFTADLFDDIFKGTDSEPSDYLKVTSSTGLLSYEILGKTSKDIAMLSGQDSGAGASQLYSPQYVVGGTWRSTLSIVNLDPIPGVLMLKLIADDGTQIGPARFVDIAGGGKVYVSDQAYFGDPGSEPLLQGYVEVTGLGLRLAGSVVFSDAKGVFTSALPLVSVLQKSAIFSHVASNETYFTGLAILNPNPEPAVATIDLYGSDGNLAASKSVTIPARRRKSALLSEYFPGLVGQDWTSGYFKVTVDNWVACFALFGTNDLAVLSAIPGQPVP
jgi:hypothetical protein